MKVLVVYGTSHGSTARIATRVATRLRALGADVTVLDAGAAFADLEVTSFDAVVVGGRVWGNRYPRAIVRFVREHVEALRTRPSAFLSVNLWCVSQIEEHRSEAAALPRRFTRELGWTPSTIEVVAGTLAFSKAWLGPVGRWLMRKIWTPDLGPLDPTRDHERTDWAQVERFAESFFERVQRYEATQRAYRVESPPPEPAPRRKLSWA